MIVQSAVASALILAGLGYLFFEDIVSWQSQHQWKLTESRLKTAIKPHVSTFKPQLLNWEVERTDQGTLALIDVIGTSIYAVVSTGVTFTEPLVEYVIKYSTAPEDRLLAEYSFLLALNGSKLSPHVYSISSPVAFDSSQVFTRKVSPMHKPRGGWNRLQLRFMVMEPLGHSLSAYFEDRNEVVGDRTEYLREVLHVGIRLIGMLQDLHALGIVHNDIHGKNIVFGKRKERLEDYNPLTAELRLIDFEGSVFFPNEMGQPVQAEKIQSRNVLLMSPWALQGERVGRRDDLYNLFELLALYLSNFKLDENLSVFIASRASRTSGALDYKTMCNLFDFDLVLNRKCCEISDLTERQKAFIRRTFQSAMNYIRGQLRHPDEEPDYELLTKKLRSIDDFLVNC